MDKYELFLRDLSDKTSSRSIQWRIASANRYSEYIYNPQFIYQIYDTQYVMGNVEYNVALIQRKDPTTDEYDNYHEKYSVGILVFNEGKAVLDLGENHVDRDELFRLAACVEDMNEDTSEFFRNFE